MSDVKVAVIPAAGLGTRFLPASKVVPKELLPLIDRPILQHTLEEARAAGIERVVLVIRPGKEIIARHFERDRVLESILSDRGRADLAAIVREASELMAVEVVEQAEPLGLGHAVLMARAAVGDAPFAVMLPDDVFTGEPVCLAELIEVRRARGGSVLGLIAVDDEGVSRFGIIDPSESEGRLHRVASCVEKPPLAEAPSRLGVLGRYVLEPAIFDILAGLRPGLGGELQLTDALSLLAGTRPVWGYQFESAYNDTGTIPAYIETVVRLALADPRLGPGLRPALARLLAGDGQS